MLRFAAAQEVANFCRTPKSSSGKWGWPMAAQVLVSLAHVGARFLFSPSAAHEPANVQFNDNLELHDQQPVLTGRQPQ
jgi:hypothetical protein